MFNTDLAGGNVIGYWGLGCLFLLFSRLVKIAWEENSFLCRTSVAFANGRESGEMVKIVEPNDIFSR